MKKNRMMRLASILLVCVLLTTSVISGTFAKYTTTTSSTDKARVAVWGINKDAVTMNLFDDSYTNVAANDDDNLIAPGVTKTSNFSILNTSALAPEVKYALTISVKDSAIHEDIKANDNIVWKLDDGDFGTWDELMTAILQLSGNDTVTYVAGTTEEVTVEYDATKIATEFANGKVHTITWMWVFDDTADVDGAEVDTVNNYANEDAADTALGNAAASGDLEVKLVVSITATQVD